MREFTDDVHEQMEVQLKRVQYIWTTSSIIVGEQSKLSELPNFFMYYHHVVSSIRSRLTPGEILHLLSLKCFTLYVDVLQSCCVATHGSTVRLYMLTSHPDTDNSPLCMVGHLHTLQQQRKCGSM